MRALFLCNTVYQILVALWIKHTVLNQTELDIMISDHMNDSEEIYGRVKKYGGFDHCYYVKSIDFARSRYKYSRIHNWVNSAFPERHLNKFVQIKETYDELYLANADPFSQLLFRAVERKNRRIHVHFFEDGLSTYSQLFQKYLNTLENPTAVKLRTRLKNGLLQVKYLPDYVQSFHVFNPELMQWTPKADIIKIGKIRIDDSEFREICNKVFAYTESDQYDTEYLFMEESYSAEGLPINDVDLINQLADIVGKKNIMVKIHPRNPVNRFLELGIKTNKNTAIPWELILMNQKQISSKKLITIGSASVLNPKLLFGMKVNVYSLYNLVSDEAKCRSGLLNGSLWELIRTIFEKYPEEYKMVETIEDIVR